MKKLLFFILLGSVSFSYIDAQQKNSHANLLFPKAATNKMDMYAKDKVVIEIEELERATSPLAEKDVNDIYKKLLLSGMV